jgi:allophanate hydrolase subunit 1
MYSRDLDTQPATNRWWANRDANRVNLRWEPTYSEAQRVKASQMRGCLDLVYGNRAIHVNYRERFISIKVDRAVVRDRTNLRLLEADWAREGIERRQTAQGIIYRIPRA